MLEQFLNFIRKENLGSKTHHYLLAVSGGMDSVVMCDLFKKTVFSFAIAHCNFKLRGKESDEDEKWVRNLAKKHKVSFFCKSFDTSSYSEKNKISIQMAARDLRYIWLTKIAAEKKYDFIATAHHLDDSIETFFINLLRGTGIAGLQGVPLRQNHIVRPLLFATKKMIREYAKREKLLWREDSSNIADTYLRNNIRHHFIPSLKKLNVGFEKTIARELSYFKDAGEIFKKFVEKKKREIMVEKGRNMLLSIKKLKDSGYAETLLHELLKAYDFTPETTELIAQRLYTTAGKKFLSPTYRLIKDRDFLILTPNSPFGKEDKEEFVIKKSQREFKNENLHLKIETCNGGLSAVTDTRNSVAYFDYSKLHFPLKIRKWKPGDFFHPLGMNGKKKLSNFFIDQKISVAEKETIHVIESEGEIAWIINHRIDDRFKVTSGTKKILRVSASL